jgi:hypothetical protein
MIYPETVKVENKRLVIQTTEDMKLLTPDEKLAEKLNDVLTKIKTR